MNLLKTLNEWHLPLLKDNCLETYIMPSACSSQPRCHCSQACCLNLLYVRGLIFGWSELAAALYNTAWVDRGHSSEQIFGWSKLAAALYNTAWVDRGHRGEQIFGWSKLAAALYNTAWVDRGHRGEQIPGVKALQRQYQFFVDGLQ